MRLIDADTLIARIRDRVCGVCFDSNPEKCEMCEINAQIHAICREPTVDAQPVRHGHWDIGGYIIGDARVSCSECGFVDEQTFPMPFCGRCGAKMDEEEDKNG